MVGEDGWFEVVIWINIEEDEWFRIKCKYLKKYVLAKNIIVNLRE